MNNNENEGNRDNLFVAVWKWILNLINGLVGKRPGDSVEDTRRSETPAPVAPPAPEEPQPTPPPAPETPEPPVDPTAPNLSYLKSSFAEALTSFYQTVERILQDNPVDVARLADLAEKESRGDASDEEKEELAALKLSAFRQGKAMGAVYGFFLRFRPYPMLAEVRARQKVFQPPFGPVLVVDGDAVRDVLSRHDEFTVDPYGREMVKSMTPAHNGGFDTFILSTDASEKYVDDKRILTAVVNHGDAESITSLIHDDCMRRVKEAVEKARAAGDTTIDVVPAVARFVPTTLGHHYLGVPVAPEKAAFELTDAMLEYYGKPVAGPDGHAPLPTRHTLEDGTTIELPNSALGRNDGVIPDELQVYNWIKSAFQNFFNNIQKDVVVQARGVRAYRELLVYILREIDIQKKALGDPALRSSVPDTMLTRLLRVQMNMAAGPAATLLADIDPKRVCDLRIAENVMGTIVGAIAGQEEATCRVIDSIVRLKEGEYETTGTKPLPVGQRYGSFDELRTLALNVLDGRDVAESRRGLRDYVWEALRLQPQGEILLRECAKNGSTIADSRPIRAGTFVFAAHGSAMQDVDQPNAFIVGREQRHYLQHGYGRHKCLGQYVSPVLMIEALIAMVALEGLQRPEARPGETDFPLERRFGRLQFDDNNLYATTFNLAFSDSGTTTKYF